MIVDFFNVIYDWANCPIMGKLLPCGHIHALKLFNIHHFFNSEQDIIYLYFIFWGF